MKTGVIYVITNKAMPGIVKIGYSKDVNKRLNSLYSSNVPFPFEVYATLEGVTESADKEIHKFLPSSLRVNNNREFFNITPEYAYDILFQIAKVFGVTNRLKKWDEEETSTPETQTSNETLKPRHINRICFWDNFNKMNASMGNPLKSVDENKKTSNWQYFSLGGGGAHMDIEISGQKHEVRVLYLTNSKKVYDKINAAVPQIENEVGVKLTWNVINTPKKFCAMLKTIIPGLDFSNTSNYPVIIKEAIDVATKMKNAYKKLGFAKS